jgi:hypothetical protein
LWLLMLRRVGRGGAGRRRTALLLPLPHAARLCRGLLLLLLAGRPLVV